MTARLYALRQRNGGARVDTSRQCCDGLCLQRNPSQGGSCPVVDRVAPVDMPAPTRAERAVEAVCWVAALGLMAFFFSVSGAPL